MTRAAGVLEANRLEMTRQVRVTQVGLRAVKAGLGGHDDGVLGSTRGSRAHHSSYQNGDDWQCRIVPLSVIFMDKRTIVKAKTETT